MKPQVWKHQFAIEFRPATTPHTLVDGKRWFRMHERQWFKPFYVRDEADTDIVFVTAYGAFRYAVDNMYPWACAVRLVERFNTETIEHARYFPGKDPPVKGATMTWDEVRERHAQLGNIVDELEAIEAKRDSLKFVLITESLRRLNANLNTEDYEAEVPRNGLATGRIVARVDGGWECEDVLRNVYGFCIYNDDEDPCHDNCLFCHHPEERK